jgi:hypothetical protein
MIVNVGRNVNANAGRNVNVNVIVDNDPCFISIYFRFETSKNQVVFG